MQLTDFAEQEIFADSEWPPSKKSQLIELNVPIQLEERRIYCYVEVKLSSASAVFALNGEIVLYNQNEIVSKLPLEIGNAGGVGNPFPRSLRAIFNAGGSPVGDCLSLVLADAFTSSSTSAILQPLRVNGKVTKIVLNFTNWYGASNQGYRLYLACLSVKV